MISSRSWLWYSILAPVSQHRTGDKLDATKQLHVNVEQADFRLLSKRSQVLQSEERDEFVAGQPQAWHGVAAVGRAAAAAAAIGVTRQGEPELVS